jgi:hypothetical protein
MPKEGPIVYKTPSGKYYTVTKHNTKSYKTNRLPKNARIVPETAESKAAASRTSGTSKRKRTKSKKKATTKTTTATAAKSTTTKSSNVLAVKETIGNRTYVTVGLDGEMLTFAQVLDALMSSKDNATKRALHKMSGSMRIPQDDSFHLHDGFVAQIGK